MIKLFEKRVYDISAVTDKTVRLKYNSNVLPVKTFKQYIDLYIEKEKRVYEELNDRWEYAVALSPYNEFTQISFVNGIYTSKGGKHVEYVLGQIVRKCLEFIETKKKVKVNYSSIKEQLMLFLRCDIDNPSFDSQTKDTMTTPSIKFGSTCSVSDNFIKNICTSLGVMNYACSVTEARENRNVKKTDGVKSKSIHGIPKYVKANWAGTIKSSQCTLLLSEGDSAKAGILSGLSTEDRNIYGIYPLKGKLMNVRGETSKKIYDNKEIIDIKKILGLETGKKYNSIDDVHKCLRYSKILFMTDQDLDGSHIKGLCINLFASEWPTLLKVPGFIGFMNTPILKSKKGNEELMFYNDGEYENWKKRITDRELSKWKIKYYKGLGTSTGTEFKQYFKQKKLVGFNYTNTSDSTLDMVFNKKKADERKNWLSRYSRSDYLNTTLEDVSYDDFVNKELIHFSKYDCDRNIPNIMDGLKISLRKILYAAFKKNLFNEIKVAQFTGYVSEHSCYHHGEASLNQAIVGMAQNFVGSNNIPLLYPSGQFGTRLQGGKDSASERYIYTRLQPITKMVFNEHDFQVLTYLNDDGTPVEPIYYVPIIPMILVNGSKGIGTGFSTDILCYNPTDICNYILEKLKSKLDDVGREVDFTPYYEGFKGTTTRIGQNKYVFKGLYNKIGKDKIRITELPIGTWTQDYKEFLETLESSTDKDGKKITPIIKDFADNNSDSTIDFTLTFANGKLDELEKGKMDDTIGCNALEKVLKLYTTNTTTNMHLFNSDEKLQKYETVQSIIDDYYVTRLKYYGLRKESLLKQLEIKCKFLSNKSRYIQELLDDSIDLRRKNKTQINDILKSKDYMEDEGDYNYLIKMPMDSVSEENVDKLNNEFNNKQKELKFLKNQSIKDMWTNEINLFLNDYEKTKKKTQK